jgi:Esterase-like activity of phytase
MNPRILCAALLLTSPVHAAEVKLQAYGEIAASARDSLGDTIGGIGSAITYDERTKSVFLMPDRGAGDGTIAYTPRCYRFRITPRAGDAARLDARLEETIIFRDANGRPFTGLLADKAHKPERDGLRCLDPEAIAIAPDGTLYVSDEYAPALMHFDRSGRLLDEIALPEWYRPRDKKGSLDYSTSSRTISGRDENRGAEALGILPGGKRAVLVFQSALVQDGGKPAGTTRMLIVDLRSGKPIAEYAYPFGPSLTGFENLSVNDLAVVDAHTFLVLERDGFGRSGPFKNPKARYKAVWVVDTRGATNLLKLRDRPYDQQPSSPAFKPLTRSADVRFVKKTLLFNLPDLLPQLGMPLSQLSAKWEGIALLPPKSKREFHLLMTADNDFLSPVLRFDGKTTRFPRAVDSVPTQFFEILAQRP